MKPFQKDPNKEQNAAPEYPLAKVTEQPNRAKQTVKYLILLVVVLIFVNPNLLFFLPEGARGTLSSAVSGLFGDVMQASSVIRFSWVNLFKLVIMLLAMLFLYSLAQLILERMHPSTQRGQTLRSVAGSLVRYGAVLLTFFWGLALIGVNVSTIFASVGILALVVGFGAESLIADVVTGMFMLFEGQFQVGDIVEIDGFRGTISAITIRTTCVTDGGDNVKIFNNSAMKNIINLSNELSAAVSDVPVGYEADLGKAREAMDRLLPEIEKKYPEVFVKTPAYLGVQQLADSAVVLRVVAHVREKNRFSAVRILNEELKMGLERYGMPAPFPQLDVHQKP